MTPPLDGDSVLDRARALVTGSARKQAPLIRYCVVLQEATNYVPQKWEFPNLGMALKTLDSVRRGPSAFVSGYLMIVKPKAEAAA